MSYNMFLDDIRIAENYYPNMEMITVRSYNEAIDVILKNGLPTFISFDHDLGDVYSDLPEKTGYDVAKYLIDYMLDNNIYTEFYYKIHSSNPSGAANIDFYIKNAFNHIKEL